jgi:hypothetical protein
VDLLAIGLWTPFLLRDWLFSAAGKSSYSRPDKAYHPQ